MNNKDFMEKKDAELNRLRKEKGEKTVNYTYSDEITPEQIAARIEAEKKRSNDKSSKENSDSSFIESIKVPADKLNKTSTKQQESSPKSISTKGNSPFVVEDLDFNNDNERTDDKNRNDGEEK